MTEATIYRLPIHGEGFSRPMGGFEFIHIGGTKYDRKAVIDALAFYEQIKAALGTQEDGANLVDVARAAHMGEQSWAKYMRKKRQS